jgi:hypothetical protein
MVVVDNKGMDNKQKAEYQNFIKSTWSLVTNLAPRQQLKNNDFVLLKDKTNNFSHVQSPFFYRHIFNDHGNAKTEAKQGQLAIDEADFHFIPDIVESPSFKIEGIKYKEDNCVLYGKNTKNDNTYIYIERISNKRYRYSAVTFYNINKTADASYVMKKMANNAFYDLNSAVVINGSGGGSQSTDTAGTKPYGAAANSANPAIP